MQYAVLVVDDDHQAAEILSSQLSLLGHTAVTAFGPRGALQILGQVIPDVIFMDLNMPGVNGLEIVRFLRREPLTLAVPVIVASANDTPDIMEAALQAGANYYLIKPLMIEDVELALSTVMDPSLFPEVFGAGQ